MCYKNVLVVTDNLYLAEMFHKIINSFDFAETNFDFVHSFKSLKLFSNSFLKIKPFDIKNNYNEIIGLYDLLFSIHCKQIFPPYLVNKVKCINIHPGLNPLNRGWYPHVFSIINKFPAGATIHEIDEEVDHGAIIDQEEVKINSWDTSLSVYKRIIKTEIKLIKRNIEKILNNQYVAKLPDNEGNYNSIKDFHDLCHIDLNETNTYQAFIDRLRALSHGQYNNAYFYDPSSGKKVFLKLGLTVEADN